MERSDSKWCILKRLSASVCAKPLGEGSEPVGHVRRGQCGQAPTICGVPKLLKSLQAEQSKSNVFHLCGTMQLDVAGASCTGQAISGRKRKLACINGSLCLDLQHLNMDQLFDDFFLLGACLSSLAVCACQRQDQTCPNAWRRASSSWRLQPWFHSCRVGCHIISVIPNQMSS